MLKTHETIHAKEAETPEQRSGGIPFPFSLLFAVQHAIQWLRPTYDGPASWLWFIGFGRLIVLLVVAVGAQNFCSTGTEIIASSGIFLATLGCSSWYLLALYRKQLIIATLTWAQVLLDFCVVAFIISLTGGGLSYFTFLLILVVLESGILLGMFQGFAFAVLSLVFLLLTDLPKALDTGGMLPFWYSFLIQWIVMISTAVLSGYWNQRISRLKQFQREILDNMVSGFIICNKRGTILGVNRAACAILNMREASMLDRGIEEILTCASGTECPVITALRNGQDYVGYEFLWQPDTGEPKMLGLTTNHLVDRRGRLINLIVVLQDLTDITAMRLAIQQQDRMAAVGESAAELAHEIRNPLTALRSAVDELQRSISSPEMMQRLCVLALQQSEHLNRIVSGFLDFVRNPELKCEPVEINTLLENACETINQAHPDIRIALHCPEISPVIPGDATQLRQMCDNVLQNSVEAMSGQGEISVTVLCKGNYVELRFDDNGTGISPDKAMRIFEPFYTEKEKGIGMGLAVCLRIVTAHNGDIRAAARSGGGLSMIVRLPRALS